MHVHFTVAVFVFFNVLYSMGEKHSHPMVRVKKQVASRPYIVLTQITACQTYANNLRIAIPVLFHSNDESDFHLLSTISQQHGCCYVDVHRKLRRMN